MFCDTFQFIAFSSVLLSSKTLTCLHGLSSHSFLNPPHRLDFHSYHPTKNALVKGPNDPQVMKSHIQFSVPSCLLATPSYLKNNFHLTLETPHSLGFLPISWMAPFQSSYYLIFLIILECPRTQDSAYQGLANYFYKGPDSKYFQFGGHMVSVAIIQEVIDINECWLDRCHQSLLCASIAK